MRRQIQAGRAGSGKSLLDADEKGERATGALTWAERMVRSMPARRLRFSLRRRLESYSRIFLRAMAMARERIQTWAREVLDWEDWEVSGLVTGAGRAARGERERWRENRGVIYRVVDGI